MSDLQEHPPVAALILAAGDSSRMGPPKQLLEYGGTSLLRRAATVAVESGLSPVVVVLGAHAGRLWQELAGLPVAIATNDQWSRGMGSSIRVGVAAIDAAVPGAHAVLIMLGDQPLVGPGLIRQLLHAHRAASAPVVACQYQGTLGAPALFSGPYLCRLRALPDESGAKSVIISAGAAARIIPFPEGAVDIDTPEDYQRLVHQARVE